jgi:hypothetical protein
MSILTILIVLIIIGILLWAVNKYIPMDANIKSILNIVVVIFVVIWLLRAVGAFEYLNNIKV